MSALAETSRDRLRGDTFEALAVVTQRTDAKSQRYGPAHGGIGAGPYRCHRRETATSLH